MAKSRTVVKRRKKALEDFVVVVPARLASTRLPEKPLADLCGKPLVVRVCENLQPLMNEGAELVVATDSEAVVKECSASGYKAVLTRPDHASGTDRCLEAASHFRKKYVLNVQGDEPFIPVEDLLRLAIDFAKSGLRKKNAVKADIGTLAYCSTDLNDFANPNVVKAIVAQGKNALYFTRASSPWHRDSNNSGSISFWHHMGVYLFRMKALKTFCSLKPSRLEQTERLEQLRALENGMTITVYPASRKTIGIDTPDDLEAARQFFSNCNAENR